MFKNIVIIILCVALITISVFAVESKNTLQENRLEFLELKVKARELERLLEVQTMIATNNAREAMTQRTMAEENDRKCQEAMKIITSRKNNK